MKLNQEIEWLLDQLKETKLECEHTIVNIKDEAKVQLEAAIDLVREECSKEIELTEKAALSEVDNKRIAF